MPRASPGDRPPSPRRGTDRSAPRGPTDRRCLRQNAPSGPSAANHRAMAARGTVCHDHRDENGSWTLAHRNPDRSDRQAHEKFRAKSDRLLGEAVALLKGITGRFRPDESAELYETMGILLLQPGDASSIDLRPTGVPHHLTAESYCERLVDAFRQRNPFLFVEPEHEPIAPIAGVDPAASAAAPATSKKRTR